MTDSATQMMREVQEIPEAVEQLLIAGAEAVAKAAAASRAVDPQFLVSIARGSSDHACTCLKYASELLLGLPVASVGPSLASIYGTDLRLKHSLTLAVSQSGRSPDILAMTEAARRGGSLTLALTNDAQSPLAGASERTIDICAGPERSVAATKTFVNSVVAGLMLLAEWKADAALKDALHALPEALARAASRTWPDLQEALGNAASLYTLGRGPAWAISNEAALKFKETCQIHAESYSSAEVLHGPVSIVGRGFPVLCFAAGDVSETSVTEVAEVLAAKGAQVFVTSDQSKLARSLPHIRTGHGLTDPLALIVSFYAMIEGVARARGVNPDAPRHLTKVTETI